MSSPLKVESSIQGKDLQHGQHMLTKQKTASQAGLSTFRDCFFPASSKGGTRRCRGPTRDSCFLFESPPQGPFVPRLFDPVVRGGECAAAREAGLGHCQESAEPAHLLAGLKVLRQGPKAVSSALARCVLFRMCCDKLGFPLKGNHLRLFKHIGGLKHGLNQETQILKGSRRQMSTVDKVRAQSLARSWYGKNIGVLYSRWYA